MGCELVSLARWWSWLAARWARQLWDSLPGPWPVRVLLVAGCLAVPGPADELVLIALVTVCKARKARRNAR